MAFIIQTPNGFEVRHGSNFSLLSVFPSLGDAEEELDKLHRKTKPLPVNRGELAKRLYVNFKREKRDLARKEKPGPCPFCKKEMIGTQMAQRSGGVPVWRVHCYLCSCLGPGETTRERAVIRWNGGQPDEILSLPGM